MGTEVVGKALIIWQLACNPERIGMVMSIRTKAGVFDHGDRLTTVSRFPDHFPIVFEF
jgi:hypothetical protein